MTDTQRAQELRAEGKTLAQIATALGRNPKHTGSISRMLKTAAPFTHSGEVATTAAVTELNADTCICEIPFTGMDDKCWSCAAIENVRKTVGRHTIQSPPARPVSPVKRNRVGCWPPACDHDGCDNARSMHPTGRSTAAWYCDDHQVGG